jgi:integrase
VKNGLTFTPHDLRRTFATRLSDLGVAPHVIEKLLNHKMPGVMAVYNRADYWPERVAAMEMWCKKVGELRRRGKKVADSRSA